MMFNLSASAFDRGKSTQFAGKEEDKKLIDAHALRGNKWVEIGEIRPARVADTGPMSCLVVSFHPERCFCFSDADPSVPDSFLCRCRPRRHRAAASCKASRCGDAQRSACQWQACSLADAVRVACTRLFEQAPLGQ